MQPDDSGEGSGVLARLAQLDADELDALVELAQQRANGSISRRGILQAGAAIGGGALLGGGAAGSASAQASTSDGDPNVGTPSTPVDVFAEGVSIDQGGVSESALIAVAATGQTTLSSGTGVVDTGLSDADATFYLALGVDGPNADTKISGRLFWDDSAGTYKVELVETETSVGNPTVNYDILRVR